jgi:hypothetical protein
LLKRAGYKPPIRRQPSSFHFFEFSNIRRDRVPPRWLSWLIWPSFFPLETPPPGVHFSSPFMYIVWVNYFDTCHPRTFLLVSFKLPIYFIL